MRPHSTSSLKVAFFWAICGAIATAAIFPYVSALFPAIIANAPVPLSAVTVAQVIQAAVFTFLFCWVGLICGDAVGLNSPVVRSLAKFTPDVFTLGWNLPTARERYLEMMLSGPPPFAKMESMVRKLERARPLI